MTMVENSQTSDLYLVSQFKSGEQSAFDKLFKIYHPVVLNACYRILQDEQDARDAAQDIFLKIYHSLADWKPDAELRTWMYRITVNHCLNMIRSKKRKRFLVSLAQLKGTLNEPRAIDRASQPELSLQAKEDGEMVHKALEQLNPVYKTIIVLHRFEGLSYKEIARIMDTSVSSVESRMHRARTRLAEILEKYHHD